MCKQNLPGFLHITLLGLGEQDEPKQIWNSYCPLCCNKVLCLWPRSLRYTNLKQWQTNFLDCKRVKSQTLHNLWCKHSRQIIFFLNKEAKSLSLNELHYSLCGFTIFFSKDILQSILLDTIKAKILIILILLILISTYLISISDILNKPQSLWNMVGMNNKIISNTWKLDCVFKNQIWPNQKLKTVTLHTSYCYLDIALFYKSLAGKNTSRWAIWWK